MTAIIAASVVCQVCAGFLALRLVRLSGASVTWVLLAAGLWGMAARRALSLHRVLDLGALSVYDFRFELLGLVTSAFMLAGVYLIGPVIVAFREARDQAQKVAREKEALSVSLYDALARIRVLSGLLPICASCKSIRDGEGHWQPLEAYVQAHSDAEFTHGLCPACAQHLYPGLGPSRGH